MGREVKGKQRGLLLWKSVEDLREWLGVSLNWITNKSLAAVGCCCPTERAGSEKVAAWCWCGEYRCRRIIHRHLLSVTGSGTCMKWEEGSAMSVPLVLYLTCFGWFNGYGVSVDWFLLFLDVIFHKSYEPLDVLLMSSVIRKRLRYLCARMCAWACAHEWRCPQSSGERIRVSGVGMASSHEPLEIGVWNQTKVPRKKTPNHWETSSVSPSVILAGEKGRAIIQQRLKSPGFAHFFSQLLSSSCALSSLPPALSLLYLVTFIHTTDFQSTVNTLGANFSLPIKYQKPVIHSLVHGDTAYPGPILWFCLSPLSQLSCGQ